MSITVVLIAGSLAVSPIAIAGDDEDDEEGDDDSCSPDFTCIPSDDDESCPAGFTCEEECDDGDDCELRECEANGDDDGICARPEPTGNTLWCFCDVGDIEGGCISDCSTGQDICNDLCASSGLGIPVFTIHFCGPTPQELQPPLPSLCE